MQKLVGKMSGNRAETTPTDMKMYQKYKGSLFRACFELFLFHVAFVTFLQVVAEV